MANRSVRYNSETKEFMYFLNDREVTKKQWHEGWLAVPPNYSKGECPRVKGDLDDFSHLNGGKGIWNPQVNGWCRNVAEVELKGRAKGYKKIG